MLPSTVEQVLLQELPSWNLEQDSKAKYCALQVTKLIFNEAAKTPLPGMALGFSGI